MKILMFENEFNTIKTPMEVIRLRSKEKFEYSNFTTSQAGLVAYEPTLFDVVIIDIELSSNSITDGYGIVEEILKINNKQKIIILSGFSNKEAIAAELYARGVSVTHIITKPINFKELEKGIFF